MPDELRARFEQAAEAAQRLERRPDNATLLRLYALYKQATAGDAAGKRPGALDLRGRAKHDAWAELAGMNPEAAMEQYVALVGELEGAGPAW